jgi:serine/threonine protein kinase
VPASSPGIGAANLGREEEASDRPVVSDKPVDRLTFFSRLRQSRLLAPEQLADVVARFPASASAQDVAAALIADGVLTRFQARQLWGGQVHRLVLGQYRILDELGKGGFGHVYKAVHTMMGRVVALKVILPELVKDNRARDWFKREVLAVTQLSHPNIVMAYDANEVDDSLFLVMEFIDGPSLETLVRQQGPLPVGVACAMLRQAALALQYASEKGMVHRDVKPANLLIASATSRPDGAPLVKVVDFGLARLHTGGTSQTLMLKSDKSFVGTPDYVSPEQARDVHAADIRSDLYSLGCTFYFALAGRRPFRGNSVLEMVIKHFQEEPEPLQALRSEVPVPVVAVISRLMAKDPARRFQTPAELAAALEPFCQCDQPSMSRAVVSDSSVPAVRQELRGRAELEALSATALVPSLAFWTGPQKNDSRPRPPDSSAPPPAVVPSPGEGINASRSLGDTPPGVWATTKPDGGPTAWAGSPETRQEEKAPSPIGSGEASGISAGLRQHWQQWLAVIEVVAAGKGAEQISPLMYRELHGRLLAACRSELQTVAGPTHGVLERLEALVEPWLTPYNLAVMDREALASLLRRCRQLDRLIGGRERGASLLRWAALFGVVFLGLLLAGWVCRQSAWIQKLSFWASGLWQQGLRHPLISMAVILPVVVLTTLYVFARFFRA